MSRIGKRPISVPSGVKLDYSDRHLECTGPKGKLAFDIPPPIDLKIADGTVEVEADWLNDMKARALMGTIQATVQNMVTGVSEGFARKLELVGVGYRAQQQGKGLELALGYSRPVQFDLPEGVQAQVESNTAITLSSHDKVLLGQTCARLKKLRPPEPFQGKGIRFEGERIRRKAGKSGKK